MQGGRDGTARSRGGREHGEERRGSIARRRGGRMGRARGGEMGNREGEERGIMKRVEAQQRAGETAQREGGGERGEKRM